MASKTSSADPRGARKSKRPTAYVSASPAQDTRVLLHALEEHGVEAIRLDDMAVGVRFSEWVRNAIERADYVIAVMESSPSASVLFELGMATGMGKQVLVLAPKQGEIPFPLSGLTYLRTDPQNRPAIEFGLDQLLSAPVRAGGVDPTPNDKETRPIGDAADGLLDALQTARSTGDLNERLIIEIIHRAIKESGVSTLAMGSKFGKGREADLVVWSDDLEPWIGNPLIIEVTKSLTSRAKLEKDVHAIAAMLSETRSPRGLLIYLEAKPSALYGGPYDPRILLMSVEEFIGGLRILGLGDFLRGARNESVHAGG